jgi:adenylate cyclase
MVDYDPRTRPWFQDARRTNNAVLTEPYRFAQAKVVGVSAGMPLRQGGVIGFDFTLNTLSRLIGDYRFTPNSIIMVASDTGAVFMESEACRLDGGACLPGEAQVRTAMRSAITQAVGSGERLERDVVLAGRDYRLLVHQMPPALGRRRRHKPGRQAGKGEAEP